MTIKIFDRWMSAVLHEVIADTMRDAVMRLCREAAEKEECADLTDANLRGANLRGANLTDANLTDADLTDANLRGANLRGANLTDANLTDANLTDANLTDANLTDADLRGANLRGANLTDANLTDANLRGANLTDANLRGANLTRLLAGVPIVEHLDQRIAEAVGENGAHLDMADWHDACGTTHCRAGWAIHLAGEAGAALEARVGPATAGALIYMASTGRREVPDFYADTEEALADIKRCAALGVAT